MNKSVTEQIHDWLSAEKDKFNDIVFGEINFIIQNGKVLRRKNIDCCNVEDIKIGGTTCE